MRIEWDTFQRQESLSFLLYVYWIFNYIQRHWTKTLKSVTHQWEFLNILTLLACFGWHAASNLGRYFTWLKISWTRIGKRNAISGNLQYYFIVMDEDYCIRLFIPKNFSCYVVQYNEILIYLYYIKACIVYVHSMCTVRSCTAIRFRAISCSQYLIEYRDAFESYVGSSHTSIF